MSIAYKFTLVVSLLAGFMLAASGYADMLLQQPKALARAEREGRVLANVLKVAAQAAIDKPAHLDQLSQLASSRRPALVIFYGPDARVIAPLPVESKSAVVSLRARRVIESGKTEESFAPGEERSTADYVHRAPLYGKEGKIIGALELRLAVDKLGSQPGRWALIIAGGLLMVFALFVGWFSSRAIQRPITQLMVGMDEVIGGDLTAALPLDRNDEIGRIAYRFNEMTAQLRAAQDAITNSGQAQLQLEQRLRQSEKLATIGQLSAEIAHEVGTPLNVIGGRARVLEKKADQPEGVRKNAKIIADQAARITKIIQQMLDLTRARAPQRGEVNLARGIDDALAFLEYQFKREKIDIARRIPVDLPTVYGDADGLQQVILNLLFNAMQAMPGGGELKVETRAVHRRKGGLDLAPPQQYVEIVVEDTGEGIDEAHREMIFEPFYSTKGKGQGTGLGLTVVHGIIKEHDGWIDVEAGAKRGTIFRIFLPTESDHATNSPADADPEAAATPPPDAKPAENAESKDMADEAVQRRASSPAEDSR